MYYWIRCGDDGEVIVRTYEDKAELLKALADEYGTEDTHGFFGPGMFPNADPQSWCGKCLLIKGVAIVPKKEKIVVEYSLP